MNIIANQYLMLEQIYGCDRNLTRVVIFISRD